MERTMASTIVPEPEPNWRSIAEDRQATIDRLEKDLINERSIKETFYNRYQRYKSKCIAASRVLEQISE